MTMFLRQFTKPLPFLALIAATYPVLMIFVTLLAAVGARFYLGHWPSYGNPDPGAIAAGIPAGVVLLCLVAVPLAPLGTLALAFHGRRQSTEFPFWLVIILSGVSLAVFLAFTKLDPGGFLNWLAD